MIRDIPRSLPIPDVSLEQDSDQAPWTVLEYDPEKVWKAGIKGRFISSGLPAGHLYYAVFSSESAAWRGREQWGHCGTKTKDAPYPLSLHEAFDRARLLGSTHVALYDESLSVVRTWTL